ITGLDNPNSATPMASPSITTQYFVTVTDANGCSDMKSVLVLVPTVTAGSNRTICSGSSTQLNAVYNGTALSYQWIPSTGLSNAFISNPIASPASSVIYTVRVNDAAGCQVSAQVRVIVNPSPTVNAGADVSIAPQDSTRLNGFVAGASNYLWNPSTGLSNPTVLNPVARPTATTVYILSATGSNGCVRTDTVVVTVDPNLSGGTLSGRVVYDRLGGAVRTPVTSGSVILSGNSAATSGILAGGTYAFPGLPNGGYQVRANVSMSAGGITTADAFLINNYLSNPSALSGLAVQAADANGDGIVNSADALLVLQRSINLPNAIFSTPWVSDNAPVTVTNSNPVRDIAVLSRGDVNRDFTFSSRLVRGIQIEAGAKQMSNEPVFTLPVLATCESALGSFQMHVELANGLVVKSIRMSQTGERVLFNQLGNQLYLGWYTTGGPYTTAVGSGLFEVAFEQDIRGIDEVMTVVGFAQATDYEATPYAMLRVQVPVFSPSNGLELDLYNFPNPFSTATEIIYQLPEDGAVQFMISDYTGKTIYQSDRLPMSSGKHGLSWNAEGVADGVYMLHVRFDGPAGTQTKSTKLMIRR
ncbi:MAG: dockerin type I domain-containing protein, partial [Bacteroidota bacterium]